MRIALIFNNALIYIAFIFTPVINVRMYFMWQPH